GGATRIRGSGIQSAEGCAPAGAPPGGLSMRSPLRRRIVLLPVLGLAALASGCVTSYGHRHPGYSRGGYYGRPVVVRPAPVIVQRPVVVRPRPVVVRRPVIVRPK